MRIRIRNPGFCIKLEISKNSLPIYYTLFALKRCTYSGPRWWFGLFRSKLSSRPRKYIVSQGDEVTLPSVTPSPFQLYRRVTELPDFWDSQNSKSNFFRKTMCETIEKIAILSVYFFSILWIKRIFEGDLVFFKNTIS